MNITKAATGAIVNQADQAATSIIIHDFNEADNAVFCSLLDVDGAVMTSKRVFPLDAFPCDVMTDIEKEIIKGATPDTEWDIPGTRLWLDCKGVEYQEADTQEELLVLVDLALHPPAPVVEETPAEEWSEEEITLWLENMGVECHGTETKEELLILVELALNPPLPVEVPAE